MSSLPTEAEILLYSNDDGDVKIDVLYQDDNIWLTQKKMGLLFEVQTPAINKHLKNIFESGELIEKSVISKMEITASDGKKYPTQFYNLDTIIAVGYRVNSKKATQFRIWATATLKEFIIKGFVLDDKRLKNGQKFGKDYFDELLERIREIRTSERRFYQKITDIYAECSVDYNHNSEVTQKFYATVQNKMHWTIHGSTAAEIIASRADHKKPNMGLTTWENSPKGKIIRSDVNIAKSYLSEEEIAVLNHIASMYLDYAELQAKKQRLMTMQNWVEKLDAFLCFNDFEVLEHAGKVSTEVAKTLAEKEFDQYRVIQDQLHQSDFDKLVEKVKKDDE